MVYTMYVYSQYVYSGLPKHTHTLTHTQKSKKERRIYSEPKRCEVIVTMRLPAGTTSKCTLPFPFLFTITFYTSQECGGGMELKLPSSLSLWISGWKCGKYLYIRHL